MKSNHLLILLFCALTVAAALTSLAFLRGSERGNHLCSTGPSWCFTYTDTLLKLPNLNGDEEVYAGQTYGIAWGDADGDILPDLYLNHHTRKNTANRFPDSHLVLNVGQGASPAEYRVLSGGDQHAAIFYDLDKDGSDDILESIGGLRGKADPADSDSWNRVYLSSKDKTDAPETAREFGLEGPGGRGRSFLPINSGDHEFLAIMNAPRDDGLYPSLLAARASSTDPGGASFTNCGGSSGLCGTMNIEAFQKLAVGYPQQDQPLVAILSDDYNKTQKTEVYSIDGGVAIASTDDFDHKYGNASFQNLFSDRLNLVTRFSRRISIFDVVYEAGTYSFTKRRALTLPGKRYHAHKVKDFAIGDMNNDSRKDIIALYGDDTDGILLVIWEQRQGGTFDPQVFPISALGCRARNFAIADANVDGGLDIIVGSGRGQPFPACLGNYQYLENQTDGNWLALDLVDTHRLSGLGARVEVITSEGRQFDAQDLGIRGEVQDHKRMHFGLGRAGSADIVVRWRKGVATKCSTIPANAIVSVTEGLGCQIRKPGLE